MNLSSNDFFERTVAATILGAKIFFGFFLFVNIALFVFSNIYVSFKGKTNTARDSLKCSSSILVNISEAHKLSREKFSIREDLNLINPLILSIYRQSLEHKNFAVDNFCDLFFTNIYPYEKEMVNFKVPSFFDFEGEASHNLLRDIQGLPNTTPKFYISYNIFRKIQLQEVSQSAWSSIQNTIYSMHTSKSFAELSQQEKLFFSSTNLAIVLSQMKQYRKPACVESDSLEALIYLLTQQYLSNHEFDGANDFLKDHLLELDFGFVQKNYNKTCQ